MTTITLHEGDNRDHLRRLIAEGVRVHSAVMDPPYGLVSTTKRFGGDKAAPAKFGTDGAFARASAGFMGSKWDGTGIERDPEFWRLIYDILLPGGYVVAFSSPRTGHWQACAMEMAGFIMHPFLGWVYGQGFPKAHNAAQAVEKQITTGAARRPDRDLGGLPRNRWSGSNEGKLFADTGGRVPLTTPEAQAWDGWAYGGQSLKPALEPIYVAQKPFSEKNGALNILRHGVGALNIDACRVPTSDSLNGGRYSPDTGRHQGLPGDIRSPAGQGMFLDRLPGQFTQPDGRHPANLLHDTSAEVITLFPQSAGQQGAVTGKEPSSLTNNVYGQFNGRPPTQPRNDAGSAARFFNGFPMSEAEHDELRAAGMAVDLDADVIRYQGKATKADRAGSRHPTVKPVALMQWLVRLTTPRGGIVLDPFAGSGTTGEAARQEGFDCILMEAEEQFAADIRQRFALAPPVLQHQVIDVFDLIGAAPAEDPLKYLLG